MSRQSGGVAHNMSKDVTVQYNNRHCHANPDDPLRAWINLRRRKAKGEGRARARYGEGTDLLLALPYVEC